MSLQNYTIFHQVQYFFKVYSKIAIIIYLCKIDPMCMLGIFIVLKLHSLTLFLWNAGVDITFAISIVNKVQTKQ